MFLKAWTSSGRVSLQNIAWIVFKLVAPSSSVKSISSKFLIVVRYCSWSQYLALTFVTWKKCPVFCLNIYNVRWSEFSKQAQVLREPSGPSSNVRKWYTWFRDKLYGLLVDVCATLWKALHHHGMELFLTAWSYSTHARRQHEVRFISKPIAWSSSVTSLTWKHSDVVWYHFWNQALGSSFGIQELASHIWLQNL